MDLKINKDIVVRSIDGLYYIVDPSRQMLHSLNETGTAIFEQMKKGAVAEDIIKYICEQFEVEKEQAEKDLNELIAEFKKKKIID
ncbi:PqqD family protein [Elusimicrobiota bacterium]